MLFYAQNLFVKKKKKNLNCSDHYLLTLNHFISGRSSNAQGAVDINEKDIDSRRK